MPRLAAALAALVLTALAAETHADIVPAGQRYVPVKHALEGTASIGDRTLYLVTTSYRGHLELKAGIGDGPLDVPSGYMSSSYLVALTPAQVKELDALRKGQWSEDTDADGKAPLREFFKRKDVAASPGLYSRDLVPRDDPRESLDAKWRVDGVKDDALVLTRIESPKQDAGSTGVQAGLSIGAGALVALAALARRKR